jgi:2,3-bisphosphoglycerate-independent phosphoglycerate mutase
MRENLQNWEAFMKHVIFLCDGMSDYPDALSGKTPMEAAYKPNMDALCASGRLGRMQTLYPDLPTGSDTANLSVLGYDPHQYYTGRSPIEALGLGIPLEDCDLVFRMNLVTLSEEEPFEEKRMVDHSADKITTEEAAELVEALALQLQTDFVRIHSGVSYRHVLILKHIDYAEVLTPPHDILGRTIGEYLPKTEIADSIIAMMKESFAILSAHPVNIARKEKGLRPANCLWLWGQGRKPNYPSFSSQFGIEKGLTITAVPLVSGLAYGMGLDYRPVEGATGDFHTNYKGKAQTAIDALQEGYSFVFVHVEAPDECGHDGDAELKTRSIERIDAEIVGPVVSHLKQSGEPFRILITPDHATPVSVRTHTLDPVPFVLYDSAEDHGTNSHVSYTEKAAERSDFVWEDAYKLMSYFIRTE